MKKAIIFDLDGTLWDSGLPIAKAWTMTFKNNNIDKEVSEKEIKSLMGKPMSAIIESLIPEIDPDKREILLKECCDNEEQLLRQVGGILFPGLEETLKTLKAKGYHLSIVSNCQDGYIETFLDYHNMHEYFDDLECPGKSGLLKAENIKLVIKRNNIDKAIYVGDTQGDMDATDKAGIPFVFAKYGFGNVDKMSHIIYSLDELPDMADKIFETE